MLPPLLCQSLWRQKVPFFSVAVNTTIFGTRGGNATWSTDVLSSSSSSHIRDYSETKTYSNLQVHASRRQFTSIKSTERINDGGGTPGQARETPNKKFPRDESATTLQSATSQPVFQNEPTQSTDSTNCNRSNSIILPSLHPKGPQQQLILPSILGLQQWRDKVVDDDGCEIDGLSSTTSSSLSSSLRADKGMMIELPVAELYRADLHLPSAPTDWQGYENATPLSDEITAIVGVSGRPLSTAAYMRLALTHPTHGYYTVASVRQRNNSVDDDDFDLPMPEEREEGSKNCLSATTHGNTDTIIGADFVTAPEVSHVFGECIGVWFASLWNQAQSLSSSDDVHGNSSSKNNPQQTNHWQWLECGPGKGSLMVDLLRFTLQLSSERQRKRQLSPSKEASLLFGDGCQCVHFIERSPAFRQQQRDALVKAFRHELHFEFDTNETTNASTTSSGSSRSSDRHKRKRTIRVHWHDSLTAFQWWQKQSELDGVRLPTFVVGQEFLDALPVYAFEKTVGGYWRERLVDVALRDDIHQEMMELEIGAEVNKNYSAPTQASSLTRASSDRIANQKKPRLRIVLAPEATPPLKTLLQTDNEGHLPSHMDNAPSGSVVEVCPEGILFVQDIATILEQQGGAALFIDYGSANGSCDSLRGFARHQQVHFLSQPGHVDVTADVDFLALQHAINNRTNNDGSSRQARAFGPTTQGEFLMAMGIQERVVNLMERDDVSDEQAENLYHALIRLASPDQMGERYKVMAISTAAQKTDGAWDPPPGF